MKLLFIGFCLVIWWFYRLLKSVVQEEVDDYNSGWSEYDWEFWEKINNKE